MYLFIDSTVNVTVGLLGKDFSWIEYKYIESKKSSALLHYEMDSILKKNGVDIENISGLIYVSGPGSYTGMRVSEGIAQIMAWQNIVTYSLYHFDIPEYAGMSPGYFVSKAFKGEAFVCMTDSEKKELIPMSTLAESVKGHIVYSNENDLDLSSVESTATIIKKYPQRVFKHIVSNNIKKEVYYYRDLEQEFSRNG